MRVYTALASGSKQVWNRTSNAGNFWVYAAVNITTTARFEITFDAEIGKLTYYWEAFIGHMASVLYT